MQPNTTTKPLVLVVEDDMPIRSMLRYALEMAKFTVYEAEDVAAAESTMAQTTPDLILLDWMLPQVSGITFAKRLKQSRITENIPIIMLTAKTEEEQKVIGLEAGADDYVVKPFSPKELIARIRAVLRRGPLAKKEQCLCVGELTLDPESQKVTLGSELIKLGRLEFRLLHFFLNHQNRVFSRDELLTHVWGSHSYVDERTVDVHIRRLRKRLAIKQYDRFIQTVHGSGYRFFYYTEMDS